ncbi:hypothetical protein J3F83DRAFT_762475 [Trichoderma novae-zelandiae]
MEAVTRQHFFFHDQPEHAAQRESCHFCQLRAFPTHKDVPVTMVNDVDEAVIPPNFRFVDRMVLRPGVQPAEDSFRSGCSCDSDGECQYMGCLCLADLDDQDSGDDDDDDDDDDGDGYRIAHQLNGGRPDGTGRKKDGAKRKAYAYHSHGVKAGLLRSKMLNSKEPLYECHAGCSCSKDCPNRVVERGRTVPLQIFRTHDRGWGVHAQAAIKKGQFVDRYFGEIITSAEADRRRAASAVSRRKDVYLFALDKFTDPDSLDARLKGPPLEVDGEFLSGPTRFINHSCEPNLRIFARVGDHADKHIHDLALFAIRDIPRGEELTFDYVDGRSSDGISSSPPSPVALTLRRRARDDRRRRAEQYALGRPRPSRTLCGNDQCLLRCCNVFATGPRFLPVFLLGDNERSADGVLVRDILTDFAYLASTRMWPSSPGRQGEALLRAQSIEAFAASPPVRAAYLDFRGLCEKNDLGFTTESRLRDTLAAAMPPFCDIAASLDAARADAAHVERLVHRTLQASQRVEQRRGDGPLPWTREGCAMRFLLTAELWRRHDGRHMRRRGWAWGGRWRAAEMLSGVLLQYWLMDRERCFERVSCRGGEQWDEVWQDWVDKYPLLGDGDDDDDDDDNEEEEEEVSKAAKSPELVPKPIGLIKGLDLEKDVGYVGGVGTAHRGPLWIERRQRHGVEGLPQH